VIDFLVPAFLLLIIPAAWLLWRFPGPSRPSDVMRGVAALALILVLAQPYLNLSDQGRSLIVLVDRSLSMPDEAEREALDAIRLMEEARQTGDMIGVISFGGRSEIESLPNGDLEFVGFERHPNTNATDLAGAIETALAQIPAGAPGSILILSDGESNGGDPMGEARRALSRGIRVDVLPITRPAGGDVAVERLELPPSVATGEPFQFSAWIRADSPERRSVSLLRNGRMLTTREVELDAGLNRVTFRDLVPRVGVAEYEVRASPKGGLTKDRIPENDRGLGAVRVIGAPRVLVLNEDGAPDTLTMVLEAAAIPVTVMTPEDARLDRIGLTPYRAIILENVDAGRLGHAGMKAIADFVDERGGGLLMTGGEASFGIGGYYLSPIDPLLPVSLEMRQEHRKMGVAMAMVLDRSGSMGVEVAPGVTKMDLANAGTASAIEMLSGIDAVTVLAVDTEPHEIVSLRPVNDPEAITKKVRRIESMGGGIYVYNGLLAAGKILEEADQANKHVILFADANDAEQPAGVPALLDQFAELGITVSVIALGTDQDTDSQFLFEIAERGGGDIYFTLEPEELPRLFTQDTMTVARSTFITEPTATAGRGGLFAMGEFGEGVDFPTLSGYNLTYQRPTATTGVVSLDEFAAPIFAFNHRGVGRTAALTPQVGGQATGLVEWPDFPDFLVTTTRWLIGEDEPEDYFVDMRREGSEAVVRLEADPTGGPGGLAPDTSKLELHLTRGDGSISVLPLDPVGELTFELRLPLTEEGVALGSIHLADNRVLTLPPVALPYSPEYLPQVNTGSVAPGVRLLERLAQETGGSNLTNLSLALAGTRATERWRVLGMELLWFAIGILLLEILVRRLELFGVIGERLARLGQALARASRRAPSQGEATVAKEPAGAQQSAVSQASPAEQPAGTSPTHTSPPAANMPPTERPKPQGATSIADAMERARRKAGKRFDR
jgi:Mg-chelatase subunit ChlD